MSRKQPLLLRQTRASYLAQLEASTIPLLMMVKMVRKREILEMPIWKSLFNYPIDCQN